MALIFEEPTRADVRWPEVVTLIEALGGKVAISRKGSRVCLALNGRKGSVHSPHPGNIMSKGALRGVRDFLKGAEVKP